MTISETAEFIKSINLFAGFPEEELHQIISESRLVKIVPDEAIIEFGDAPLFMGVLLSGQADLSIADDSGVRHTLDSLEPGSMFGYISLMSGQPAAADVIGSSACEALLIPETVFNNRIITAASAVQQLSRAMSEHLTKYARDPDRRELAAKAFEKRDDPYGFKLKCFEPTTIVVINCGSSSLKYNFFNTGDESRNAEGVIENIGSSNTIHRYIHPSGVIEKELSKGDHSSAFEAMCEELTSAENGVIASPDMIKLVGHRVVHGGSDFTAPVIIDDEVISKIEKLSSLAPLHNPINVKGIREAMRVFSSAYHIAVFDTAFHHTMPPYAHMYGLPSEYSSEGVRRYGFHGTSHAYVSLKAAEHLKRPYKEMEIITCHLGSGASLCAVDHGRSIDTSMGMTPTAGLLMGTRCGDIDPAALLYIMREHNLTPDQLDTLINKESGLKGMTGISNDMRDILEAADKGSMPALLAIKTFCYQVRKYIGSYCAAMGGLDAIVFTGGIGENSHGIRSMACQGLEQIGVIIDEDRNMNASSSDGAELISADNSAVSVLVIPTDEERMIARESIRTLKRNNITHIIQEKKLSVPIEVSAHHIHLSKDHVETLFGKGHELTPIADLSQPGQFACAETLTLKGPKGSVANVRVLGPTRSETQVEIAMTEQFKLGIQPPIRASGDLANTPGITLEGSNGVLDIDHGVICALRHIHMTPDDAISFGLQDHDMVSVKVDGDRELTFGDVLVRISPKYKLAMHIDTDEANAASLRTGTMGAIVAIQDRE